MEEVTTTFTETTTEPFINAVDTIHEQVNRASSVFSGMAKYFTSMMPSVITAVIVLVIGVLISRLIARISAKALRQSTIDSGAKSFLVSLIRILLYVVVVIMALSVLNVPMSSIITVFGAAGLAVSLALQNCLSNLCGGFIILFSKPFTVDDIIELDGTVGKVDAISILYTKIKTFDGKTVFIPNGKISDAKIINYTESPERRIDLKFDISYSGDYEKARLVILDILDNDPYVLDTPAPVVRMSAHKESSVEIDTLVWVANENYNSVRYSILENVRSAFERENIEIPFNQLDIHIKEQFLCEKPEK
ncbi:MAG: mechanosensitive ion channel [Ruminococcus sp.]|nr:mechanosensitive ion channel [Ruminococcus sp.]MDE6671249.1 mechanosensitive ion channel [Ruminococcus sp.]